jgi:hypothetical protein
MSQILSRDGTALTEANADYTHKDNEYATLENVAYQLIITSGNLDKNSDGITSEFKGAVSPEAFVAVVESVGRIAGRLLIGASHGELSKAQMLDLLSKYGRAFTKAFIEEASEGLKEDK